MNDMNKNLKNCPFCGGRDIKLKAWYSPHGTYGCYSLCCASCGSSGEVEQTSDNLNDAIYEKLVKKWNTRQLETELADARAEIARLSGVVMSQIAPEPFMLSSYSESAEPVEHTKDRLIEQMRESLEWALSFPACTCDDRDTRWQEQACSCGHAGRVQKAMAALSAAERGE